jgi:hypothetical protein
VPSPRRLISVAYIILIAFHTLAKASISGGDVILIMCDIPLGLLPVYGCLILVMVLAM